jgi:hypothetical protein
MKMSSTRRDFLRVSSTAAAGLAIVAFSESPIFGAQPATLMPLLSAGYARELPVSSTSLSNAPSGSGGGSLRVTIRGGARADAYRKLGGGAAVDLISPNGQRVCFWSATKVSSLSYATGVLSPMSLSVKNLASPKNESIFGISRPGVYVIAVRESDSDAAPDWNRLKLTHQGDRYVISGAAFSYAVLSVEYP